MTTVLAVLIVSGALLHVSFAQAAQKVGVAAAVNPDAFASGRVVNLGKSIFYNEQVKTSANGLVQVLLVDGSTFTVGPNSNLVIDKFVYDPAKGKGEMVATFSKGALRFVGGKLSKKDGGVTVKTPEGALAIRGGIAQLQVNVGGSKFLFDFGDKMQLQGNDGQTHTIFQPGNLIDVTGGSPFVRPTNAQDVAFFLTQLASKPGQSGGAGEGGGPSDGQTETGMGGQGAGNATPPVANGQTKNELFVVKIEDATSDEIQQEIVEQIDNTPPPVVVIGETPPPPVVDPPLGPSQGNIRILQTGAFFNAVLNGQSISVDPAASNLLGGDSTQTADDFELLASDNYPGFLIGQTRLVDSYKGEDGEVVTTPVDAFFAFQSAFDLEEGCSEIGVCHAGAIVLLAPADSIGFSFNVVDDDGPPQLVFDNIPADASLLVYEGSAVVREGFFAYQLARHDWHPCYDGCTPGTPEPGAPLLAFGGTKYDLPSDGKVQEFHLLTDPQQTGSGEGSSFVVPFAMSESSPYLDFPDDDVSEPALAEVSPLVLLNKGPSSASRSVWLQTSFYIGSSEQDDQASLIVVAVGDVQKKNGLPTLVGERRGGSSGWGGPINFEGAVGTLAGPSGAHFLGEAQPNVVIGSADGKVLADRGVTDEGTKIGGSTHIGIGENQSADRPEALGGEFKGYATGLYQLAERSDEGVPVWEVHESGVLMNASSDNLTVKFDATRNTLSAELHLGAMAFGDEGEDEGGVDLFFGDQGGVHGRSAYVDDKRFAAVETPGLSKVRSDDQNTPMDAAVSGYIASGDQLGVTRLFPEVFGESSDSPAPFCQNCDFIKWGAWGGRADFKEGSADKAVNVHLGWWVAGDVTPADDLPTQGSATYNGHVIGNVSDDGRNYIAAGDLEMGWNFQSRSGSWDVTNFDNNRSFSADISEANARAGNHFGNLVQGVGNPAIDVNGSFVNDSAGNVARGVIGNFNYTNATYKATGIFAGSGGQ